MDEKLEQWELLKIMAIKKDKDGKRMLTKNIKDWDAWSGVFDCRKGATIESVLWYFCKHFYTDHFLANYMFGLFGYRGNLVLRRASLPRVRDWEFICICESEVIIRGMQ